MKYVNTRIDSATYQKLALYRNRLQAQVLNGNGSLNLAGNITINRAIAYLLEQQENHSKRGRKKPAKAVEAETVMPDETFEEGIDNGPLSVATAGEAPQDIETNGRKDARAGE